MQSKEITEKVKKYILDATLGENDKIDDSTLIFQEGFFDSMGFVMLLGFLEEAFCIKPSDAELVEENFESINAITKYILSKETV